MRRLLLLPALLVAACDVAAPPPDALDPADLVGRWAVAEALLEEAITVTAAQVVPVPPDAAVSTLAADGADAAAFPYAPSYVFEPAGTRRSFVAATSPTGVEADGRLEVAGDGDEVALAVAIRRPGSGALHRYLVRLADADRDRVTFERLHVAVDGVVVPHVEGEALPGEVTVDGRFDFETRPVAAGETLRQARSGWPLRHVDALVLAADGGLRAELPGPTPALDGTWDVDGRTLRLRLPDRGVDQTFEADDADGGLRLVATAPGSTVEDDSRSVEARFHVEAGTAADLRTVWTLALAR